MIGSLRLERSQPLADVASAGTDLMLVASGQEVEGESVAEVGGVAQCLLHLDEAAVGNDVELVVVVARR